MREDEGKETNEIELKWASSNNTGGNEIMKIDFRIFFLKRKLYGSLPFLKPNLLRSANI